MKSQLTFFSIITLLSTTSDAINFDDAESRLHEDLTKGYNTIIRPVKHPSDKIEVKFDLALQQIVEVNEKSESLVVSVFLRQYWTDVKLKWNVSDYGNISSTKFKPDSIWVPDLMLYNNAEKDDNFGGSLDQLPTRVMVNHEGSVTWLAPAIITGKCPMNIRYFPFDTQSCRFKFGSWAYHGDEIDLQAARDENTFDLGSYSEHSEWTIKDAYLKRNVLRYGCCPEPYPDVTVELKLKRKPLFYVLNLLLPMIFIGVLTLLAFFLPAESGERISFAVTLMLALTVFMLIVAEMIPASSESVPMLGIFFTCVMIEMVLMVFAMCYTLNLHFKEPNSENRIGKWTRAIVYNRLAIYLGVRKREKKFANVNGHVKANGHVNGNAGYVKDEVEDVALKENNTVRFKESNHNHDEPDSELESTAARLMKKSIKMAEDKAREEDIEKIIKKELVACAKTFDVLCLIMFAFMFGMILLIYLLNTDV
eukprot:TCONS_00056209-protein